MTNLGVSVERASLSVTVADAHASYWYVLNGVVILKNKSITIIFVLKLYCNSNCINFRIPDCKRRCTDAEHVCSYVTLGKPSADIWRVVWTEKFREELRILQAKCLYAKHSCFLSYIIPITPHITKVESVKHFSPPKLPEWVFLIRESK